MIVLMVMAVALVTGLCVQAHPRVLRRGRSPTSAVTAASAL
jgi:hypothetical protein